MKQTLLIATCVVSLLASCARRTGTDAHGEDGDTLRYHYASLLTTVVHDAYTEVSVGDPWSDSGGVLARYALVPKGDAGDAVVSGRSWSPDVTIVRVPISKAIVFTSAHCALLQELRADDVIAGVCDKRYINLPWVHTRGGIADCGSSMAPDVERIVEVAPDVLFVSPFENAQHGRIEQAGIPVIATADYMETSALGRAEWMRFYGLLVGRQREADSLFGRVDSVYSQLRTLAQSRPKGRSLLTERKTGGVWYCPGGKGTVGGLLRDANAAYVFAHDTHAGSLPLSPEQVLDRGDSVDVWAFKVNGGEPLTRQWLLDEYHGYTALKAFRERQVYACDVNATSFFEQTAFHPEYLLRDFILLAHPGLLPGKPRYYQPLYE